MEVRKNGRAVEQEWDVRLGTYDAQKTRETRRGRDLERLATRRGDWTHLYTLNAHWRRSRDGTPSFSCPRYRTLFRQGQGSEGEGDGKWGEMEAGGCWEDYIGTEGASKSAWRALQLSSCLTATPSHSQTLRTGLCSLYHSPHRPTAPAALERIVLEIADGLADNASRYQPALAHGYSAQWVGLGLMALLASCHLSRHGYQLPVQSVLGPLSGANALGQ